MGIGPVQVGSEPCAQPLAFPWARMIPPRAQPSRFVSHDPLLKPAMKTRLLLTQKLDSTCLRVSSKYAISGESGAPVLKQLPTGLRPTKMALLIEAVCIEITSVPLPPHPRPPKTVTYVPT